MLVRDIGVYDGWLINNKNCYMGKNNNDFSSLIDKIINSDNSKIIEEGYKTVQERDLKNIGKKLKDIYSNLLEEKTK